MRVPENLPQILISDMTQEQNRSLCNAVRRPARPMREMCETPLTKKHCNRLASKSFQPVFINKSPSTIRKNGRRSLSFRTMTGSKDEDRQRRASVSAIDTPFVRENLLKEKAMSCRRELQKGGGNSTEINLKRRKQVAETASGMDKATPGKRKREDPLPWKSFQIITETASGPKKDVAQGNSSPGHEETGEAEKEPLKRYVPQHRFPRRHLCVMSRQQKEEEDLLEMKRFKFHARPLNSKIYIRAKTSKVGQNLPTKTGNEELEKYTRKKSGEPELFIFKANPVPVKILTCPSRIKPAVRIPLTCPRSPAFALRKRESPWKRLLEIMEAKEAHRKEEAALKTRVSHVPVVQCPNLQPTIPVPFHFEETDKERQAKKEMKIKKILADERMMHEFRANPMPSPTPSGIPEKQPIPGTEPVPFCLQVDKRGEKYQQQLEQQLLAEEAAARNLAKFRANLCTVTTDKPFEVECSTKPLTEFVDIKLATAGRAAMRALFDECLHEEHLNRQDVLKVRLEREQEREELERQQRRAETVHRAQPMPTFKSPVIAPSSKPLTVPQSPKTFKYSKL